MNEMNDVENYETDQEIDLVDIGILAGPMLHRNYGTTHSKVIKYA